MFHITSSLFGGLAAITAWAVIAPASGPTSQGLGLAALTESPVNRTAKADRLVPTHPQRADDAVATVEVVGVHDPAIVYRDRGGRVLFETDPMSNVTVVSRGFVLPRLTVRDTSHSTVAPVEAPHENETQPPIPIGCEPLASPIAEPQLAHIAGRCIS